MAGGSDARGPLIPVMGGWPWVSRQMRFNRGVMSFIAILDSR